MITMRAASTMNAESWHRAARSLLRLQSWLSPALPTGSYSYSHALEWAVEEGYVYDRQSLIEWLQADLCYGTVRNEAIFFNEAWHSARNRERTRLLEIAELAAAFRGTSEFALEACQQGTAALAVLHEVWPDPLLRWLSKSLSDRGIPLALPVVLGTRLARQGMPAELALPAFLQSSTSNLISAAVRLIPLGQTDGQRAIAELEGAVLSASTRAQTATIADLGSAAFVVDLASMAHETQYTRLFRS